jgi:light-regulated signal transduction histidine kinase (bacteriophytochrome)
VTAPVDLANCASEPIHIPGSIQPQGALLAFDLQGRLAAWSANAAALLGVAPAAGAFFASLGLDEAVNALLRAALADQADGATPPAMAEVACAGHTFDCVVHGYGQRVIAEFELRHAPSNEVAAFALRAHAAIGQLKRQKSLVALMQLVAEQVREITGFDRVMGYRFRHDGSGDVVAEAVRGDLPRYLGQRYPAGDIPAQARRLYTINTLRLIADVGYEPVPLLGAGGAGAQAPLDLSHSILRSVSPIHIEHLQNMGVGASMSVSIVVNGRLWGLVACHHMAPRQVLEAGALVFAQHGKMLVYSGDGNPAARPACARPAPRRRCISIRRPAAGCWHCARNRCRRCAGAAVRTRR